MKEWRRCGANSRRLVIRLACNADHRGGSRFARELTIAEALEVLE